MSDARDLSARLDWGLVPAVPVPFRGGELDEAAQRGYARWMAGHPVAGVAGWGPPPRGTHPSPEHPRRAAAGGGGRAPRRRGAGWGPPRAEDRT